ncbi:MAG: transglycosylase domain-containing protein [Actinomycetota bacterium]|nr:transglycosylase domain-containing protein [Actinomycetota bacterium]
MRRLLTRLRSVRWRRVLLFGGAASVAALLVLFGVAYALVDVPPARDAVREQATLIRYAGGEDLARLGTNRTLVTLGQISDPAQKAVLAAEDRGFYTEPGISPKGIARALFTNVRGGGVQQGGSTITQQYVKNASLTSERTYSRKVQEVFIALKMTRERTKEQILQDYLNSIYFGRGAYGIEAASKAYFGPDASARTLTAAQGAVLAASIRSPAAYDPARHPERARERFAYVLDGMVGEGWLSPEQRAAAKYPKVLAKQPSAPDLSGPAGHVVAAVRAELEAQGYADSDLSGGGITVTTTLDKAAQAAAVEAVQEITGDDTSGKGLQGALVAVEPGTGRVVAYYGGANGGGIDYAGEAARQPGSSFKPYVLATGLRQGIPMRRLFDGNSPKDVPGLARPIRNFGERDFSPVDLVTATANSVNTAYFELGLEVGPGQVADTAHAAGIPESVRLADAGTGRTSGGIALGTYEVRVLDQAVGFATFADGGTAAVPHLVQKINRGSRAIYSAKVETSRAFGEDVAADATYAMQQVVARGSGVRAQLEGARPAAGKTGTTTDNTNLWFAGYTPQLSAAVWFGYGTPKPIRVRGVTEATGGSIGAGVWKQFMDAALEGEPVEQFPERAYVGGRPAAPPVAVAPPPRAVPAPIVPPVAPAPRTTRAVPRTTAPTTTRPAPTTTSPRPTRSRTTAPSTTAPTRTATPRPTTATPTRSSAAPASPRARTSSAAAAPDGADAPSR